MYIYTNFFESKSKEYTPLAFTVSTIICLFIDLSLLLFSIVYSSIDFDSRKPYFYELMTNWNSYPIEKMNIEYSNSFSYNLSAWQGTYISKTYYSYNDTFFDYNFTMLTFNETNGKKCGKDSLGNYLYFPNDNDCPINEIFIDENEKVYNSQFYYFTIKLKNNKYLHYTKNNTEGFIPVQTIIRGEKKYCTNKINDDKLDDECFYLDNCYTNEKYFNEKECYQSDLYIPIDTMKFKDFRIDNNLKESKYYNDNDEVSLNLRTWIGLDHEHKDKLNFTDAYYEKMNLTFKWQIALSAISFIKSIFFILNNHFLWIKTPFYILELLNTIISYIIFMFELKKNATEISKIRAYYYLYCFIYENLNKNYPKLSKNKKYFIKYYYLMLASGYILKFISIVLKLLYCVFIYFYHSLCTCGCDCDECLIKNCLHCKTEKCKTYSNFTQICSCNCEECRNNKCYFCKGNTCDFCCDYCCCCCCNYCFCFCAYCKTNNKMKFCERIMGLIVNFTTFVMVLWIIIMIISPEGVTEITNRSSDFESIEVDI